MKPWIRDTRGPAFDVATVSPADPSGLLDRAAMLGNIGAWAYDLTTQALHWTPQVYDLFGIPRDARVDRRDVLEFYAEDSRIAMERLRDEAIRGRSSFTLDARIIRTDGEHRWMRLTAAVACQNGRPVEIYGLKQDITEDRLRWDELRRLAEQDALTGLASRGLFQRRFLDATAADIEAQGIAALLLFDVDHFKRLNDRQGHAAGDFCLQEIAVRLTAAFPGAAMIARIGGDEFAVLLRECPSHTELEAQLARCLRELSLPMFWRDRIFRTTVSAGIARLPDRRTAEAEALFAEADAALYHAKRIARGRKGLFRS